jgi:hypothetical protein
MALADGGDPSGCVGGGFIVARGIAAIGNGYELVGAVAGCEFAD